MKLSEIFLKAAELVANGKPFTHRFPTGTQPHTRACWAIQLAQSAPTHETSAARVFYADRILEHLTISSLLYSGISEKEARNARVIALCFAAVLAQEKDL